MSAPDRRPPARPPLHTGALLLFCLTAALLPAGSGRAQAQETADGIPSARSAPSGSAPQLLARIVDGAQDFDEWHELEIELSVTTDGARYLVRRLRVLPSDEVEPECQDVQRMGRLVLPAQATTVLPPLELEVSERQRSAWLKRLLQRQHKRYVVLALELQRLDASGTPAAASTAVSAPPAAPAALSAAPARCPDAVGADEQQHEWLFTTLPVLIDTPPWSMHVGAVLGAMLSTLFVFATARSGENFVFAPARPGENFAFATDPARRPSLRALPGELFMTALACLIAVMLLQSTSASAAGEAGLPLQVAVKDFYGGLLIGLFGRQIVGFVRRRLNGESGTPAAPPPVPGTPDLPPAAQATDAPAMTRPPGPSGAGPQPEQKSGDRP